MSTPPRPQARDTLGIVDHIRRRGSVEYPTEAIPPDFVAWRRAIRTEARRIGIRVSVRRISDLVLVLDPDYRPTEESKRAVMEAIASVATDEPISYDQALKRERRRRLRVVPDPK